MTGDRTAAAWLFLLTAAVYLCFQNWVPEEADTEVGFQATRALARRGELHLVADSPSAARILTKFPPGEDAYNCRLDPRTGRQYPYWGLAYVAAGVPAYWIGSSADALWPDASRAFARQSFTAEAIPGSEYWARAFVMALQPLFAAGAVAFLFLASRRAGVSLRSALAAALLTGFATSFAVQARSGLSDCQAAFAVAWALERALAARLTGRPLDAVLFGAAAGFGFLTKVHTAFALAPAPLLLLGAPGGGRDRVKLLAAAAAAALPFLLTLFWANAARWGSPFITGYEKSTAEAWFRVPIWLGGAALVFSPSKGLLVYAFPIAALGAAGAVVGLRGGERARTGILVACAASALAMPASTVEWHGSWAFGPRYALPAFAPLAILTAGAVERAQGRWRGAVPLAFLAGVAVVLPGMLTSPFAAIAVSMEGARERWPSGDPSFPAHYTEPDRDAERFQRLCLTAGPLNFLRVQHALARAAVLGREGVPWRMLGVDREGEALPPSAPEYRRFGGIGWIGYGKRFGGGPLVWVPAASALTALGAGWALRRALRRESQKVA